MSKLLRSLSAVALLVAACGGDDTPEEAACASKGIADDSLYQRPPSSCAYQCPNTACVEATQPYACPAMKPWTDLEHAEACGCWDGTYPTPAQGKCVATNPAGEAIKYAGNDPDRPGVYVLPDGRRVHAAGREWLFDEPDLKGGMTTAVLPVPNTSLFLTVDTGFGDHAVRLVDAATNRPNPVASYVKFASPSVLNSGIAIAGDRVFVATDDGVLQALTLDRSARTIVRDDARSIKLPTVKDGNGKDANFYVSGVAVSNDGKRIVATGVADRVLLVFDVASGAQLGSVDLGASETFMAAFDPNDPTSRFVYVSLWASRAVAEVDLSDPSAPKVARKFETDKDPQGIAFLDGRWLAVANDLGETISLVDRTTGTVSRVPVEVAAGLNGVDPSGLAWDAASKRLYVSLGGVNAIAAYDVDLTATPPRLTAAGRLPTAWWPGGVGVMDDGTVVVASMRGHGGGPTTNAFALGDSDIGDRMRGGVQIVPKPTAQDLVAGEDQLRKDLGVGALPGYPTVTCPAGSNDFPIAQTNTEGPSKAIEHVFFVVRENKDFDGLFGDMPGVQGDPSLTLKKSSAEMDGIWRNLRTLARTFTMSDNYYTDAIYSTQGHVWTSHGRSSDYNERTWAVAGGGHSARTVPGGGIVDVGQPTEGSLFDWLGKNRVDYTIFGEIVGAPHELPGGIPPADILYPGGPFQNIGSPDLEKACYVAGRARVFCNIGSFVYQTLPNDHTFGVSPSRATPETYCAVNDEATGMLVDAISHSPYWKSSIIFITEDDPSQGGEHIDQHRAPLVVVSPWVKRGYVSHTHIDVASLHKAFAHLFGKPYNNTQVANAGLPLDMFTSTPDYTPYDYKPRTLPLACGTNGTSAERNLSSSWDMSEPDEQPGLDAQVTRWMRGEQLDKLSPRREAEIEARLTGRRRAGD